MGGRWRGPGVTEVRVGVAAVRQGVVGAVRRFAGPRRAVVAGAGAALAGVWYGLGVDEATRFASFAATVAFVASALAGLGGIGWLQALYLRHRAVTLTASALAAVAFPFTQGGEAQWIRVFASIGIFATA